MQEITVRTSRPTPIAALLSPFGMARNLWFHRDLIKQFTVRMFVGRYRGTHLGVLWSVLFPLTLLAVYTFVFNHVFKNKSWGDRETVGMLDFSVILFCGMVVYGIFSESVVRAAGLVIENPNFVKKVVFPLEVLPVASLGSSLIYSGVGLVLVLIGAGFVAGYHWTILLFPILLVPLVMLSLGLGWLLSSLGVFLRDIGNIVGIVVGQILFFLTPVLYTPKHLPEHLRWVSEINPLTCIVDGARQTLLFGNQPDWRAVGLTTLLSVFVMQAGYVFFIKSKRGFGDVL